jgi:hypothetical protein
MLFHKVEILMIFGVEACIDLGRALTREFG